MSIPMPQNGSEAATLAFAFSVELFDLMVERGILSLADERLLLSRVQNRIIKDGGSYASVRASEWIASVLNSGA